MRVAVGGGAKIRQTGRKLPRGGQVTAEGNDETRGKRQAVRRRGESDQPRDVLAVEQVLPAGVSPARQPPGGGDHLPEPVLRAGVGGVEPPLEEHAEEGIAESAGSDRPGDFLGGFRKRVEAETGESLALSGAEVGFRLPPILPVELIGKLPEIGRTGDEEASMSGEILDVLPGRGQVNTCRI